MWLEQGFNLRDFGGYLTSSGSLVREGLLFRSGTMAYLTEADRRRMLDLGLAAIVDLRRADERRLEPTDWYAGTDLDYWAGTHTASSGVLVTATRDAKRAPNLSAAEMAELYRQLPYDHAASYRTLFLKVRDGALPILVNCAAGKDRTGVAVALVLESLGVARSLIAEDYCLTNDTRISRGCWVFASARVVSNIAMPDAAGPMFAADPSYLAALFDQIDRQHGGIEGYLRDELQLTPADLATVRERLLVAA